MNSVPPRPPTHLAVGWPMITLDCTSCRSNFDALAVRWTRDSRFMHSGYEDVRALLCCTFYSLHSHQWTQLRLCDGHWPLGSHNSHEDGGPCNSYKHCRPRHSTRADSYRGAMVFECDRRNVHLARNFFSLVPSRPPAQPHLVLMDYGDLDHFYP